MGINWEDGEVVLCGVEGMYDIFGRRSWVVKGFGVCMIEYWEMSKARHIQESITCIYILKGICTINDFSTHVYRITHIFTLSFLQIYTKTGISYGKTAR